MKYVNVFSFLLLILPFFGACQNNGKREYSSVLGFDISSNDSAVIFALSCNGKSSIHKLDIPTSVDTVIIKSETGRFYSNPRYSPSGKKILFIEHQYDKNTVRSRLCLANADGTGEEYLLDTNEIISSATFSKYSNCIYFFQAKEYDSYSPIGVKAVHDYDIYSLNLQTKVVDRITKIREYGLFHLSELDSDNIIAFINPNGIFLFDKNKRNKKIKISPLNDPRKDFKVYSKDEKPVYSCPAYSPRNKLLAFVTPYEMFVMDMNSKKANSIFIDNKQINDIQFFHEDNKILFTKSHETNFYSITIDGKKVERLFSVLEE